MTSIVSDTQNTKAGYGNKEQSSAPHRDDDIMAPKNFFALLIGINKYNDATNSNGTRGLLSSVFESRKTSAPLPVFPNLLGAVSDAESFRNFLLDPLQVDATHIEMLLDEKATRANIIAAFQKLASNDAIKQGDSIFIFYAGHGAQARPPKRMARRSGCPEHVEVLIPYDYSKDPETHEHKGIPDFTLAALLDKIASQKGNNITIVFDCCHSASALRAPADFQITDSQTITRGGSELNYRISDDLDKAIWGARTTALRLRNIGSNSYVYFSACKSQEKAQEKFGRGCFTQALLKLLKELGPNLISESCSQIIKRLQTKIDGQSPQCEGLLSDTRPMFHSYRSSYTKFFFPLTSIKGGLVLKGGETHGFGVGDQFTIYMSSSEHDQKNPLATVEICKVSLYTSDLVPVQGSKLFLLEDCPNACALLSKTAAQYATVYVDKGDLALKQRVEDMKFCAVTDMMASADIALSTVKDFAGKKQLRFDVNVDRIMKGNTFKLKSRYIDDTDDDLARVMGGLSHYYHHLKRTSGTLPKHLIDTIKICFYEVKETRRALPRYRAVHQAQNLCKDNGRTPDVRLQITNKNAEGGVLYPVLFYFDNTDFTIVRSYPNVVAGDDAEIPWPSAMGQSITIGYGNGDGATVEPFGFELGDTHDVEIGFFKLFLFEKPVDLRNVVQEHSVFIGTRGMYQGRRPKTSFDRWGSITLTVILRRST